MLARVKTFVAIVVAWFVFAVLPMAVAQELSRNSFILDGGVLTSGLPEFVMGHERINTLPYLFGQSYSSSPVYLDSKHIADVVTTSRGAVIWDAGAESGAIRIPQLYLLPFDVDEESRGMVWREFSEDLSDEPKNSLVVLKGSNDPEVISGLSVDAIKEQWNKLLSEHSAVRAVGLPAVVYVRLTADDAMDKRQEVFNRHEGVIRTFQQTPTQDATDVIRAIDNIFREISDTSVANEMTDALAILWRTNIREELRESREEASTIWDKANRFIETLQKALKEGGISERECFVTVSTSPENGAQIYFYKSLLGETGEIFFGQSMAADIVERARWTFVSKRNIDGKLTETGRVENVMFGDKAKYHLLIEENRNH